MPAPIFTKQLPELEVTKADKETLMRLEIELVMSYLKQYSQLTHRPKMEDRVPSNKWHEMRKMENFRVYEERVSKASGIPSIIMLGTVVGSLDEIMYGVVAASDADQRIKDRVLRDGVEQSKVLHCIVQPTEDDPVRHMSIKWQLYNTRDYVCLDTTGFMHFPSGERVGYSLTHSIDLAELPHFDNHSIDRGNRSICFFYRQRTSSTVECYARGFFDFETEMKSDPLFNGVALQVIANQWLFHSRIAQLSQMKKLAWWMTEQATMSAKPRKALSTRSACTICSKSIGRFTSVKTCGICTNAICSRCCKKKLMCVFDATTDSVVETSKLFCTRCIKAVSLSNALGIARRKIRDQTDNFSTSSRETARQNNICGVKQIQAM